MMKTTHFVPKVFYGLGYFSFLDRIIEKMCPGDSRYTVYIIDGVHKHTGVLDRIHLKDEDSIILGRDLSCLILRHRFCPRIPTWCGQLYRLQPFGRVLSGRCHNLSQDLGKDENIAAGKGYGPYHCGTTA